MHTPVLADQRVLTDISALYGHWTKFKGPAGSDEINDGNG